MQVTKLLIAVVTTLSGLAANATTLQDIDVVDLQATPGLVKFKLHIKQTPVNSFFYLYVQKEDPAGFDKLGQILNKMNRPDQYRLDMNIIDFSPSPSGSAYRSEGVAVGAISLTRQPNSATKAKGKGK